VAVPMILIQGIKTIKIPLHLENFDVSYTNNFRANSEKRKAHPARFLWEKGEFSDMTFSLKLGVLEEGPIQSSRDLRNVIETMAMMGFPPEGENEVKSIRVRIGTWFGLKGLMTGWTVSWAKPWDAQGNPLVADVQFTITPTFTAKRRPTASKFSFRF